MLTELFSKLNARGKKREVTALRTYQTLIAKVVAGKLTDGDADELNAVAASLGITRAQMENDAGELLRVQEAKKKLESMDEKAIETAYRKAFAPVEVDAVLARRLAFDERERELRQAAAVAAAAREEYWNLRSLIRDIPQGNSRLFGDRLPDPEPELQNSGRTIANPYQPSGKFPEDRIGTINWPEPVTHKYVREGWTPGEGTTAVAAPPAPQAEKATEVPPPNPEPAPGPTANTLADAVKDLMERDPLRMQYFVIHWRGHCDDRRRAP